MTHNPPPSGSGLTETLLGHVLDERFRIDSTIGQGGMGTVFSATQLSVDRTVAVKVLDERADEIKVQRFMREARVISSFSHPNIVQIVDFGRRDADGLLFLVMERVDGMVLGELTRLQRLHPNLAIEICAQIAAALAEAHSHQVIHRDLKPSNVMVAVTADNSVGVKVLDFGVAHVFEETELTRTGQICGTPAYMAPEQVRGDAVTPASDIYALGLVLFEMLGGFRPYSAATPLEIAVQQIHGTIPSLRPLVHRGEIPAPLLDLCERMLSKTPEERPGDGRLARDALLAVRRQAGLGELILGAEDPWEGLVHPAYARHGGKELLVGAQVPAPWSNLALPDSVTSPLPAEGSGRLPPTVTTRPAPKGPVPGAVPRLSGGPSEQGDPTVSSATGFPSRHGPDWSAFKNAPGATGDGRHQIVDPNLDPSGFQRLDTGTLESALIEERVRLADPHTPAVELPSSGGQSLSSATGTREIVFTPVPQAAQRPLELDRPEAPGPRPTAADRPRRFANWGERIRLVLALVLAFVIALGILSLFANRTTEEYDGYQPAPVALEEDGVERRDAPRGGLTEGEDAEVREAKSGARSGERRGSSNASKTEREEAREEGPIDLFEGQDEAATPRKGKIVIDETEW